MHTFSARELHEKFLSGKLSASVIVKTFLDRIERYDGDIQAFLRTFPEKALETARQQDEKRAKGEPLGLLAGVPIAIKDNIHIQGELTTCASKFLANYKAPFAATAIERLEAEDAIIIGKTNMDEFAMGSSTENSALQITKNPWDLLCVPGGSSGGSAAAVAARLCPIALGSDTGGSIRQPASFCGVVGMKPTYGRVSRFGLVAFGSSLDQIGPLANNVEDVAMVMEVLGAHCERDSTSLAEDPEDYLCRLSDYKTPLRLGVPWQFLEGLNDAMKQRFDDNIKRLKDLGAQIVDVDLDIMKYGIATYYILATAEASTNLARFDGIRYGVRAPQAKSLDEVYDLSKQQGFGQEVKRRIMLGTYVLSAGYQDAYYKKAQKVRRLMIQQFRQAFEKCDVVATPVTPTPAFPLGAIQNPLEMYLADCYTIAVNLAGLPAMSLPGGFVDDKPVGLQLIGPQKGDVALCQVAYTFEKNNAYNKSLPKCFAE